MLFYLPGIRYNAQIEPVYRYVKNQIMTMLMTMMRSWFSTRNQYRIET